MRNLNEVLIMAVVFTMVMFTSCKKDEPIEVFMGTAYVGQSIPVNTKYSYSEGTYSAWASFIDPNSYNWGQAEGENVMPSMVLPCEYNGTTGEFSDLMQVNQGVWTFGATRYFPTSFCIDDFNKLYLFTFDAQKDTNLIFPRTIAEKITGSEGNIEGSYHSNFKSNNWVSNNDGIASQKLEGEVNYTYSESTFSGTFALRTIFESDIEINEPDWGVVIGIGLSDTTATIEFSGTWEYNEANNTITETITSPVVLTNTYTPYWVSYNNKLYLGTSLTRVYEKDEAE